MNKLVMRKIGTFVVEKAVDVPAGTLGTDAWEYFYGLQSVPVVVSDEWPDEKWETVSWTGEGEVVDVREGPPEVEDGGEVGEVEAKKGRRRG